MRFLNFFVLLSFIAFAGCGAMEDRIKENSDDPVTDVPVDNGNELGLDDQNDNPVVIEPDEEELVVDDSDSLEETVTETSKKYFIIGGSFKEFQNAEELYNELSKQGKDTEILPKYQEFNRVVISSFDNEAEARAELNRLRAQRNNNDLWLLIGE